MVSPMTFKREVICLPLLQWVQQPFKKGENHRWLLMLRLRAHVQSTFVHRLGAIHALSHPIGALYDTHHGLSNAVFMPYVLAFNRPVIEERTKRLTAYVGIEGGLDGLIDWVVRIRRELNIPHTLRELLATKNVDASGWKDGVAEFNRLVDMAIVDPTAGKVSQPALLLSYEAALTWFTGTGGNPIPMTKVNTAFLLKCSLEGVMAPAPEVNA